MISHLDSLSELLHEQVGHVRANRPLAPPEHEDVDGRAGGADVGEDPREELAAFDVGLDGGRGRPGVVQADVSDPRP